MNSIRPAAYLSEAGLKASSERIHRMLRQLSWVVPAVVLVLFALAVLGFYEWVAKPQARAQAVALQHKAADSLSFKIESTAQHIDQAVLTLRDWVQTGVVSLDDVQALNRVMMPMLAQSPLISSIHVAHASGREVLLLKQPDGWRNRITNVPTQGQQQHWLGWKNAQTPLADEWKTQDYDPRKRPWFTGAMTVPENVVYWTAPYTFATTQEPGITASLRWRDATSGEQMVIALDVLLSDLSAITLSTPYTPQGGVMLLSPQQQILGLPRNLGLDIPQAVRDAVMKRPAEVGLTWLDEALSPDARNAAEASTDSALLGQRVVGPAGQAWRVKSVPMPLRNQPLRLVLLAPDAVFAPWSPQVQTALWAVLVSLLLGGWFMARRLNQHVAIPVGHLFEALNTSNQQLIRQSQQAQLLATWVARMQKAPDMRSLGQTLLSALGQHFPLGAGSLYQADEASQTLSAAAGFATLGELTLPQAVPFGSGLMGQCALDQRPLRLDQPGPDYIQVQSALSTVPVACLLLLPVQSNRVLQGVLELALLRPPTDDDMALLSDLLPTLAMCMEILSNSEAMRRLLEDQHPQGKTAEKTA